MKAFAIFLSIVAVISCKARTEDTGAVQAVGATDSSIGDHRYYYLVPFAGNPNSGDPSVRYCLYQAETWLEQGVHKTSPETRAEMIASAELVGNGGLSQDQIDILAKSYSADLAKLLQDYYYSIGFPAGKTSDGKYFSIPSDQALNDFNQSNFSQDGTGKIVKINSKGLMESWRQAANGSSITCPAQHPEVSPGKEVFCKERLGKFNVRNQICNCEHGRIDPLGSVSCEQSDSAFAACESRNGFAMIGESCLCRMSGSGNDGQYIDVLPLSSGNDCPAPELTNATEQARDNLTMDDLRTLAAAVLLNR